MQDAADAAYQEAENLWFMFGFVPSANSTSGSGKLPSLSSWFLTCNLNDKFIPPVRNLDAPGNVHDGVDSDYESNVDNDQAGKEDDPVAVELHK